MSIKDAIYDYLVADSDITDLIDFRLFHGTFPGESTGLLTFAANASNTETVTIDTKIYTFQSALENVDGNVKIGATAANSIANLVAAMELGAGSGAAYAAAMTEHQTAFGERVTSTQMAAIAHDGKNKLYATTETLSQGSWGQATMNVYPYVVFNRISAIHDRHMTAADGLADVTMQFDIFDVDGASVEAVAEVLRERMHGKGGGNIGTPSVGVRSITLNSEQDIHEPPDKGSELGIWRTIQEYTIWHAETVPTF